MNFIDQIYKTFESEGIAVIENNKKWSYSEFKKYVLTAKAYFERNKISKVMICLPQGFFAYTVIWGAYLAGITFCPINILSPRDRIKFYKDVFQPDSIIHEKGFQDIHLEISSKVVDDIFCSITSNVIDTNFNINSPNEIAYVIFTSGSTGIPKGVMIKRKALNNFLLWTTKAWGITDNDVYGQFSNLGFDLSIADIFTAVLCGATLVPISSIGEKLLPGKMIQKHKITFWHSVPSVVDLLEKSNHINLKILNTLKKISFCGERLFPKQLEKLFDVKPDLIVFNTYGPTEITIFCTFVRLSINNYKKYSISTIAIGDTIPGWNILLDKIEDGVGEIVVAGENIAFGYLMNSDNKSFSKVSLNGTDMEGYYTGDFATYEDNKLYFMGRKDSQIKHKGYRIDLSEIDFWMREFGCSASITTYINGKIISFVIIKNFREKEMRKFLESKLPEYSLPHKIYNELNFPLNGSGKINIIELVKEKDYDC